MKSTLDIRGFIYFVALVSAFTTATANAGQISDALGLYLPDTQGQCKGATKAFGKEQEDTNLRGVCVPLKAAMWATLNNRMDILSLGVAELNDPKMAEIIRSEMLRKQKPAAYAYEVEIESHNDDIFKLVDGSVLQETSHKYVGYIGWHEKAILYKDGTQWRLCLNNNTHDVDMLKDGGYGSGRSSISKSILEIERSNICS